MYKKAAEKLAEVAINKQIIASDDKEMYIYAYEAMFARILGWGTLLLLGIIFQCLPGTLAFFIVFFPLRIFAGGYHARNYEKCYLTSTITFAFLTIGCRFLVSDINPLILVIIVVVCLTMILMLAPVGDENKPLDQFEQIKYGIISKVIATVEAIVIILMVFEGLNREIVLFSISALSLETALLLAAKCKTNYA
ncbi:MAG: accessory gene regulator B family protein [Lachnospiraceae bacterium]|nr:accessory gene regulator B family protein [Lachnospiraceae bacterium]